MVYSSLEAASQCAKMDVSIETKGKQKAMSEIATNGRDSTTYERL